MLYGEIIGKFFPLFIIICQVEFYGAVLIVTILSYVDNKRWTNPFVWFDAPDVTNGSVVLEKTKL